MLELKMPHDGELHPPPKGKLASTHDMIASPCLTPFMHVGFLMSPAFQVAHHSGLASARVRLPRRSASLLVHTLPSRLPHH